MTKRFLMAVGLLSIPTFALADSPTQTITIQPGQGSPVTVQITDNTLREAPYALTGRDASQFTYMRLNQGDLVRVPATK